MSWLRDLNDAPQVRHAVRQCGSVAAGGWGSAGGRSCGSEEGASISVWGIAWAGSRGGMLGDWPSKRVDGWSLEFWCASRLDVKSGAACRLVAETLRPVD